MLPGRTLGAADFHQEKSLVPDFHPILTVGGDKGDCCTLGLPIILFPWVGNFHVFSKGG